MYRILISLILATILLGCSQTDGGNVLPDGNVTEEEAEVMQESWCEYNEGKEFAEKQCAEYWEESSD